MAHFELEYDYMHLHQDLPASSGQSLRRHDLLNFIASLYEGDLHAKRVLSLANATLGVLTSASLAIHAVGRGLAQALGTLTKHGVKQVDRLLSNRGVDVWTFFAYWTPFIVGARTEVIVALDWTSFAADGQDTIVLSMVTGHGRATPLLWKTVASSTLKVYQGEDPDALKNVEIGTFLFSGLNRRQGAHAQGILFTYSLDLDGLLHVHARERATGREIRSVVENAIGRSSDEALGAARERVSALWGVADEERADAAGDAAAGSSGEPGPAPAAVPLDVAHDVRDTLARAEQALEAAPAEDREEMINLMEDHRDAVKEGRAAQASDLRRDLEEILFYLE